MTTMSLFSELSDRDLLDAVKRLASDERQSTAHLIACLAEVDARRLYLGEGCSSLFTYCTQVLHLSEHAAYGRIEAARAARRFPAILDRLTAGEVTLTAVGLLAPHLTPDNHLSLLDAARHRSKRDVEHLVVSLRPQPPVTPLVRKIPDRVQPQSAGDVSLLHEIGEEPIANTSSARASDRPASTARPLPEVRQRSIATVVAPLAPDRYKVQLTVSAATYEKLRRVQDLMRHSSPRGDVAAIFDRGLTMLLDHLQRTKLAAVTRPRSSRGVVRRKRTIPAAVRRAVWARDEGRCAFAGTEGRCAERGFLEFHHVDPHAAGGTASASNIELRCRAHNQYEAERDFPRIPPLMVRERRPPFGACDAS